MFFVVKNNFIKHHDDGTVNNGLMECWILVIIALRKAKDQTREKRETQRRRRCGDDFVEDEYGLYRYHFCVVKGTFVGSSVHSVWLSVDRVFGA